jgi:hypothetical protein
MSRRIETAIEIEAPPASVWAVLTDFEAYPEWNPFIRRARGAFAKGARLEVLIEPPGGRAMTFRPRLLVVEPERELRWIGRLVMPGLFDGEHLFRIEPLEEARVRFRHEETFGGVLVPLFWKNLEPRTRRGFEAMNRALKERAEARQV